MNNIDLHIELLTQLRVKHPTCYYSILQKQHFDLWQLIEEFAQKISKDVALTTPQKIYHWINQLETIPLCPVKKVPLKFFAAKFEYRKFSERGLFTQEFVKNRTVNRSKFPNAQERLKEVKNDFYYESEYKNKALNEIQTMFNSTKNIGGVCSALKTKKNAKLFFYIKNLYPKANTFTECLFLFVNKLKNPPLCPISGLQLPFINFKQGYKTTHPNFAHALRKQNKQNKLASVELLTKEETVNQLQMLLNELKQKNISLNNLKQSASKRCPSLVISVEEYTKNYTTLTQKWSERAYLLLHEGNPKDIERCRFTSFEEGYCDTYVHVNSSHGEESLASWIETLSVGPVKRHMRILNGMEVDIFVNEKNLAIEYHGEYYHNFEFRGKNYHKQKADIALNQNLNLIQIFESEWYNKQDIVKSIIKSKLGIIVNKIKARECEVKRINSSLKDQFLVANHIQGTDRSVVALGLFYKSELVSCMTFGRGYNKKKDQTELVRFCNKLDTTVVGGASKLLKAFITQFNPTEIFTYADRRFANQSKFYEILGFQRSSQTNPNYFYFKSSMPEYMKLMHRYNFAKHLLARKLKQYNSSLTEYENMKQNGYLKIYDAGSFKYQLKLN